MKKYLFSILLGMTSIANAQVVQDTSKVTNSVNAAQRMLNQIDKKLTIGSYGEVTYNQPESLNGELDIQRIILMLGYKFNDKVQFITEFEIEHVNEMFVEQAFLNYSVGDNISLRGGLMLVPMGIINEFHEPTTFNGVERPALDTKIVPSTWREIGVGINGRLTELSLSYQAYIFNGFKSTQQSNGQILGLLGGESGVRGGRQKAIQSTVSSPNLSFKMSYYGLLGLRLGFSGYFGKTQTDDRLEKIDGTTIGVSMVTFDARYKNQKIEARGQFTYAAFSDTEAYNTITENDLGAGLLGYYIEAGYNVLSITAKQRLVAFARYEKYDTHYKTEGNLVKNKAYNRTDITMGVSYHIADGVVVKGDYQIRDNAFANTWVPNMVNIGIGFWY